MVRDDRVVVILVAMAANIAIAISKFVAFLLTGSASMLAETYHSISDTGNQVLLLTGVYYSRKRATRLHPFGYGKAHFFYALLVSVLLFGIAGWESIQHGISSMRDLTPIAEGTVTVLGLRFHSVYVAYAVLVVTILFDGLSYLRAKRSLDEEVKIRGWRSFKEAFEKTSDTPVLAVLVENAIATAGATIALVAIFLSRQFNDPRIDAAGAILIGLMLMAFAIALGWENKQLLIGESLPRRTEGRLKSLILEHDCVVAITDVRTVYFGPENVILTADVVFEDDLDTETIDTCITAIEDVLKEEEPLITKVYIEPEV